MTKPYHEECLERAERAKVQPLEWAPFSDVKKDAPITGQTLEQAIFHNSAIAMVEELARRLKRAIEALRGLIDDPNDELCQLANELESPLGAEKA